MTSVLESSWVVHSNWSRFPSSMIALNQDENINGSIDPFQIKGGLWMSNLETCTVQCWSAELRRRKHGRERENIEGREKPEERKRKRKIQEKEGENEREEERAELTRTTRRRLCWKNFLFVFLTEESKMIFEKIKDVYKAGRNNWHSSMVFRETHLLYVETALFSSRLSSWSFYLCLLMKRSKRFDCFSPIHYVAVIDLFSFVSLSYLILQRSLFLYRSKWTQHKTTCYFST